MSASYVRTKMRTWAQMISAPLGVQYYDTVNREVNPTDSTWWTMGFYAEFMDGQTFCGPGYMEIGAVEIVVLAQPGIGDEQAVQDLEAIVRELMRQTDSTQRLVFEDFEPPQEHTGGSADKFYRVAAFVGYRLSL